MQMVNGRPAYPYVDDELRKVARDAYVAWQGSRYSVPWEYAGKEVWVRECGRDIEVRYGAERIAAHAPAVRQHQVVTIGEHHEVRRILAELYSSKAAPQTVLAAG